MSSPRRAHFPTGPGRPISMIEHCTYLASASCSKRCASFVGRGTVVFDRDPGLGLEEVCPLFHGADVGTSKPEELSGASRSRPGSESSGSHPQTTCLQQGTTGRPIG